MSLTNPELITVVVPFVAPFDLQLLDLTFFSLSGQSHSEIQVILQISEAGINEKPVLEILKSHSYLFELTNRLTIQKIDFYGLSSWREAWKEAKGNFIVFLEPCSILYKNAIEILLQQIEKSRFPFSVTGSLRALYEKDQENCVHILKKTRTLLNGFKSIDIFLENRLSLSSCLLDKRKLNEDIFQSSSVQRVSESYQLFLNLITQHSGSFEAIDTPTSEQYFESKETFLSYEGLKPLDQNASKVSVSLFQLNELLREIQVLRHENSLFAVRWSLRLHSWLDQHSRLRATVLVLMNGLRRIRFFFTRSCLFRHENQN